MKPKVMPSQNVIKDAGVTEMKAVIILKGIPQTELADAAGISVRTLRNVLCGSNTSWKPRERLEDFFGQPFWSTREAFARRQRARKSKEKGKIK